MDPERDSEVQWRIMGHGPGEAWPREKAKGGRKGADHVCEGRVAKTDA